MAHSLKRLGVPIEIVVGGSMYEKILIVDDEEDIVMVLEDALISEGYNVIKAFNGNEAIEMSAQDPDLILLDIMLPDMDGYKVCQTIRDQVSCPIIFLSAMKDEFDHIKGFAWGGDDFITKPFKLKELLARVRAHLRREKRNSSKITKSCLSYKKLTIDIKCREVMLNNKQIEFTRREFDIIELLAMNPGQVFSREQIYELIWGNEAFGDNTTVTEFIKKIRLKLANENTSDTYITTVWGVGYKWEKS